METTRGIAQENIDLPGFGRLHGIVNNTGGIRSFGASDNIDTRAARPLGELLICRGAEGIRGGDQDALALALIICGKFADRGRLSDAVDADHQAYGRPLFKIIGIFGLFHPVADAHDQLLPAVRRIADPLRAHLFAQMVQEFLRSPDTDISHDHGLFQLVIEFFRHLLIGVEDLVHAVCEVCPRFLQAFFKFFKKSHCSSRLDSSVRLDFSVRLNASVRPESSVRLWSSMKSRHR